MKIPPIVGHVKQLQALTNLVVSGRLPSSLLFSGAHGIGKKLVALTLAKHILCQNPNDSSNRGCGSCKSCTLLQADTHPDLSIFECRGSDSSVDDLRETLERLHKRPFMGANRVTIINDADTISVVGANILLKTLEEPRPNAYFILIAETPSKLPATVLSRCQRWFFDRLSDLELTAILKAGGASEQELALIPYAEGSIATLEAVKSNDGIRNETEDGLQAAWSGNDVRIISLAQSWGSDKNHLRQRIGLIKTMLREKLISHASNLQAASVWAHALQTALDAEHLIFERNINPTLVLIELLRSCSKHNGIRYQLAPNTHPSIMEALSR